MSTRPKKSCRLGASSTLPCPGDSAKALLLLTSDFGLVPADSPKEFVSPDVSGSMARGGGQVLTGKPLGIIGVEALELVGGVGKFASFHNVGLYPYASDMILIKKLSVP